MKKKMKKNEGLENTWFVLGTAVIASLSGFAAFWWWRMPSILSMQLLFSNTITALMMYVLVMLFLRVQGKLK